MCLGYKPGSSRNTARPITQEVMPKIKGTHKKTRLRQSVAAGFLQKLQITPVRGPSGYVNFKQVF
jgi:hypothetical protein